MAFDSSLTKFYAPTSTGTQTIDTGLGVAPDALWGWIGTDTETEDAWLDGISCSWGLSDGTMDQQTVGWMWPWQDTGFPDGARISGTGTIGYFLILTDATATMIARAAITAINGDGTIDLDWDTVTGDEFPIAIHAFSGLANVAVGEFIIDDSTSSHFESLGFDPTFALVTSCNVSSAIGFFLTNLIAVCGLDRAVVGPHGGPGTALNAESMSYLWHGGFSGRLESEFTEWAPAVFGGDVAGNGFPIDRWSMKCASGGLQVTRYDNDPECAFSIRIRYLAMDTVAAEMWSPAHTWNTTPAAGGAVLTRVAANSVISINNQTRGPDYGNQTFGVGDRNQQNYMGGYGAWGYASGDSLLSHRGGTWVGSMFLNDLDAMEGIPRIGTGDFGSPQDSVIEDTRSNTITRLAVDDPQHVIFDVNIAGSSFAMGTAPYAVLGELALPSAVTEPPQMFCMADGTLYAQLNSLVNPNQLPSEVTWELMDGTTIYTFGPYDMAERAVDNDHRLPIDYQVFTNVGDPIADVPAPDIINQYLDAVKDEFPWMLGGFYSVRVIIETYNGIAEGDWLDFVFSCGRRPQILRYH